MSKFRIKRGKTIGRNSVQILQKMKAEIQDDRIKLSMRIVK